MHRHLAEQVAVVPGILGRDALDDGRAVRRPRPREVGEQLRREVGALPVAADERAALMREIVLRLT